MATSGSTRAVEKRALYYPWVHFHDDEWVKKALLVFPGLFRMVADGQTLKDSRLINELKSRSLIRHAELFTTNSEDAQSQLLKLMQEDLDFDTDGFQRKFGLRAAQESRQPSFQMHLGKAGWRLQNFLLLNKLAWTPEDPEQAGYRELHPSLGHAVMGTIAMACAEDAGLHIVGADTRRGRNMASELNNTLAAQDRAGPYKRFVRKELVSGMTPSTGDELFHVLVHFNCDVSTLGADELVRLQNEREPMRALKRQLQALADEIPTMKNPLEREQAFKDRANDVVKAWQQDRSNLSAFMREIFALDAIGSGAGKTLEVLKDKLVPLLSGGAFSTINTTAGLAIGLATHVGVSYGKVRTAGKDSPLRYMTIASKHGAAFSISQTRTTTP